MESLGLEVSKDKAAKKRRERPLNRYAEILCAIGQAASSTLDLKALLRILVEKIVEGLNVDRATIYLPDERLETIADFVPFGVPQDLLPFLESLRGRKIADFAIGRRLLEATEPIVIPDVPQSDLIPGDLLEAFRQRAMVCVPVRSKERIVAALLFDTTEERTFTLDDVALAKAIADQVALAIENARLYERLAASEAKYRSIFENAPIGIYRNTPEGEKLAVNAALVHMLGYDSVEEPLKGSVPDLYADPADRLRWQEELERAGVLASELQLRRRDGKLIWVRDVARVVRDATGRVLYYEGTITDITEQKRAEEALRQAEEKYRTIFENALMGIFQSTPDGRFVTANPALAHMLGYESPEEMIANVTDIEQLYADRKHHAELRQAVERTDSVHRYECQVYRKDGSLMWMSGMARAIYDANGNVFCYEGTVEDITERKLAEEALRQSQRQYQTLVETVSDIVFSLDMDGRVTYINPAAEQVSGYAPEELIGKSFTELIHPEDVEAMRQVFARGLRGDIRPRELCAGEFRAVAKNGDVRFLQISGQPVTEGGRIIGITGILRDVTEQRRAEQRLARIYDVMTLYQGQELFDRAAETLAELLGMQHVLIGALHEDGRSVRALAFSTQGMVECGKRYNLDGTPCQLVIQERRLLTYPQRVRELFPQNQAFKPWSGESFIGAPITDSRDNIIGIISAFNERSKEFTQTEARILRIVGQRIGAEIVRLRNEEAQSRLQEQLFQAQKMESVGTLAGGIAHEFNNLLTGIMGFTEMALLKVEPTSKLGEYLNRVVSLSGRARDLVKQLLLFSQPLPGGKGFFELHAFLNDVDVLLRQTIPESIRIEMALTSEEIFVEANPAQLQQVFVNLAVNARDAMPEGGRLSIQTRRVLVDEATAQAHTNVMPGPFVCVAVSDTGEGIPPRVLPHVFDPFFTTKEVGKGTGLGLSVAYGIVKAHGGWIEAESQAGAGASFHVYLPQVKRVMQPEVSEVEEEIVGGRETILLVEDEPMVLELGRKLLEALGYWVLTARDGREAVEVYAKNQEGIDLVLLDIVMPEMSGHRAFGEMRAMNPQVKILLVTGYSLEEVAEELLRQGAEGIVQKPFGLKTLARAVRRCLDRAKT